MREGASDIIFACVRNAANGKGVKLTGRANGERAWARGRQKCEAYHIAGVAVIQALGSVRIRQKAEEYRAARNVSPWL